MCEALHRSQFGKFGTLRQSHRQLDSELLRTMLAKIKSKRTHRILQGNRSAFEEFERDGVVVATGEVRLAPDGVMDKVYAPTEMGKARELQAPEVAAPRTTGLATGGNILIFQHSHEFSVFEVFRRHYELTGFRTGLTEDELGLNRDARKRRGELMAKGLVEPVPLADPTRPYIWADVQLLTHDYVVTQDVKIEFNLRSKMKPGATLSLYKFATCLVRELCRREEL